MIGGDVAASARVEPLPEVLTSSAVGAPMLRPRGPLPFDRPDDAWFDVELRQKDVGVTLEQGNSLEVPLPTAALASEQLTATRALGDGNQNTDAVFDVLAQPAGRKTALA